MSVIIDIISSFVIRGIIVITILKLMITLSEALYRNSEQVYLNELMSVPAEVFASDIQIAGYFPIYNSISKNFLISDTCAIKFRGDLNNDTVMETIHYYLKKDPNSDTKVLFRAINDVPSEIAMQVDTLHFKYFNSAGQIVPYGTLTGIKSVSIQLILKSKNTLSSVYSGSAESGRLKAIWNRHFFPQNL